MADNCRKSVRHKRNCLASASIYSFIPFYPYEIKKTNNFFSL